jgi:DnaJ-class molecular chaperone|tara:strand:+ start:776 stop:955 length:180 start_codon:yes stop_codon:yes gene_type:complete
MSKSEFLKDPDSPIEVCPDCDGDGFFEIDVSYNTPYGVKELYESESCPNCEGKGMYETL